MTANRDCLFVLAAMAISTVVALVAATLLADVVIGIVEGLAC